MLGASALKVLKFIMGGFSMSGSEWACLIVASVVAFVVSLLAIRSLMNYVKRHNFSAFGIYRIVLGVIVLVVYFVTK